MSPILKIKIFLKGLPYRKKMSQLSIGKSSDILIPFHISNISNITIGNYCFIAQHCWFSTLAKITIKDGVMIGPRVKIYTGNHNYRSDKFIPFDEITFCKEVIIHENAWIGGDVIILPGVHIGEGSIIAAGSVITKHVSACSIVGGNPAQKIGMRDSELYFKLKIENKLYLKNKKENNLKQKFINV